jgi:hypothetical protein
MRQALAFGILLLFVPFLKNKKTIWLFLVGVILSSLFHKITLIGVVFVLTPFFKHSHGWMILSVLSSIALLLFGQNVITSVISYTPYKIYLDSEFNRPAILGGLVNLASSVVLLVLSWKQMNPSLTKELVLALSEQKNMLCLLTEEGPGSSNQVITFEKGSSLDKKITSDLTNSKIFSLSLAFNIFFSILAIGSVFFGRMLFIFVTMPVLLFPNICRGKDEKKLEVIALASLFVLFAIIHFMRPEWYGASSYAFFWR